MMSLPGKSQVAKQRPLEEVSCVFNLNFCRFCHYKKNLLWRHEQFVLINYNCFFFIYFYQLEANYFTILWFLPYIDMNQLWIYMCSPSRQRNLQNVTPLPVFSPLNNTNFPLQRLQQSHFKIYITDWKCQGQSKRTKQVIKQLMLLGDYKQTKNGRTL